MDGGGGLDDVAFRLRLGESQWADLELALLEEAEARSQPDWDLLADRARDEREEG